MSVSSFCAIIQTVLKYTTLTHNTEMLSLRNNCNNSCSWNSGLDVQTCRNTGRSYFLNDTNPSLTSLPLLQLVSNDL